MKKIRNVRNVRNVLFSRRIASHLTCPVIRIERFTAEVITYVPSAAENPITSLV
jgi:hypothetical protein